MKKKKLTKWPKEKKELSNVVVDGRKHPYKSGALSVKSCFCV